MAFLNIAFPDCIAFGAMTEVEWQTSISRNQAGFEQRNGDWTSPRHSYDVSLAVRTASDYRLVKDHWNTVLGRLHSFPFKDPLDHAVKTSEALITSVDHDTFQLWKVYGVTGYERKITRPSTVVITRNGIPATAGSGAGQYSISGGQVTFQPDQTRSILGHTVGATHQITLNAIFAPQPAIGSTIYLGGVTGTAAADLNDVPLTVTNVAGNVITLAVNTTGKTAITGNAYIRVLVDALSWSGEFYVPCRYDIAKLPGVIINRQGGNAELLVQSDAIMLLEVRE